MTIISSAIIKQIDQGGFWFVVEEHTDHLGLKHRWRYTPTKAVDLQAKLAEHAVAQHENLAKQEIRKNIRDGVLSVDYVTKAELAAAIREAYRDGDRDTVMRIARWIRARIVAGDFTETQVRNAFGLTPVQWDALKAKLQSYDEALAVTETAAGE